MTWQIAVILRIIIGNILNPVFFKKVADSSLKNKQQFLIYTFCVIFSLTLLLYTKKFIFSPAIFLVVILGFFNSLAFSSHMRAIEISQSKSSIFMPISDIFALFLGFIFLNELQFLNPLLLLGILSTICAVILLIIKNRKIEKQDSHKKLFVWITIYTLIWGLVAFFMRYFALEGLSFTGFGISWYLSSWIGSLIIFKLTKKEKNNYKLHSTESLNAFGIALFIWTSLLLSYSAFERAPIMVIQPIFMASGMIFPVLIGLFIFKEIKQISKIEIIALLLGIAGGIIIGFSF